MAGAPVSETSLLDTVMPRWEHRTMHGRATTAPLEASARALREVTPGEARVARTLLGVRTLGRRRGAALRQPWAVAGDADLTFVPLGESPHEVVLGTVGRPWPGGAPVEPPADLEAFMAHEPQDTVKVAMSLRAIGAEYGTLLVAETRVAVGPGSSRPFGLYWRLVRTGSGLVRGSLLRAVARRAEAIAAQSDGS
jgi:hypothetical protein